MEIGEWIDYEDSIVEVTCITDYAVIGKVIVYNTWEPIHYGATIVINKDEL